MSLSRDGPNVEDPHVTQDSKSFDIDVCTYTPRLAIERFERLFCRIERLGRILVGCARVLRRSPTPRDCDE